MKVKNGTYRVEFFKVITLLVVAFALGNVKTIQINLTIRNPNVMDKKTNMPIETSFEGEVSLNNCSLAAASQPMSCF